MHTQMDATMHSHTVTCTNIYKCKNNTQISVLIHSNFSMQPRHAHTHLSIYTITYAHLLTYKSLAYEQTNYTKGHVQAYIAMLPTAKYDIYITICKVFHFNKQWG